MGIDHSWVGLVTCNGISTDWFACGDNGPTVTRGMGCNCPRTSATLAFTAGGSPIQSIMQLGLAYGDSSCFPSFSLYCQEATQGPFPSSTTTTAAASSTPTSTSTPAQRSSPSLTTDSGGVVSTVYITTPPPTSSPIITLTSDSSTVTPVEGSISTNSPITSSTGLQTQAKIGIGIGSAVGAVFVGALLWYCTWCMRKRHSEKPELAAEDQTGPDSQANASGFAENDKLGDDDPRSPTWSGHKSELPSEDHEVRSPVPAYEPYRGSYRSSQTAELEGSPRQGGQSIQVREGLYEMP